MRHILVTGAAGFIGSHLSKRLLEQGERVTGIDNLNDYYAVSLKRDRLAQLDAYERFQFIHASIADGGAVTQVFQECHFNVVVHLAAQPGVRYSLVNPRAYVESNIVGFLNILEGCRHFPVGHLVFASSSSVYGANTRVPFSTSDNVDHPISLYAATKKADELMAHTYAALYNIPCTGLRFFTVYGPWGRPDMAYFLFTKAIIDDQPITVFNHGKMRRDFTYIDDVIEGITRIMDHIPSPTPSWNGTSPDPATSFAPYRLYNIGNRKPVDLLRFITILEELIGKRAQKNFLPLQPGDVPITCADIDDLERDVGFRPTTPIEEGLERFVDWYRSYYACN